VLSNASQPPGRSSRATLTRPTLGSIQWKADADTTRSNGPPSAKSSNEHDWNWTVASATLRRAACTIAAPMSMAVTLRRRPARCWVNWPVPQPISSTALPGPIAALAKTVSAIASG
jgi:hypothetical protein